MPGKISFRREAEIRGRAVNDRCCGILGHRDHRVLRLPRPSDCLWMDRAKFAGASTMLFTPYVFRTGSRFRLLVCFFVFVAALETAHATGTLHHRIQTTEPITLRDGTVIPLGAEIDVEYDAGDDWIPFSPFAPIIPKSSASLVGLVAFNPPIEGIVGGFTPVYVRQALSRSRFASKPIPNSTGIVVASGTHVTIFNREGEYYIVNTRAFTGGLLPVGSVTVAETVLDTGAVVPLPPVPTGRRPDQKGLQ